MVAVIRKLPSLIVTSLLNTIVSIAAVSAATLQGSSSITPQDYYGLPAAALANNPPACGMPYNQLNLARITAVQNMNTGSTCNLCLKVVNTNNPSKFIYVLAVDLGGSGLDLSIPSFEYLFDQRYDASPASWTTVDYSYCNGIYTPGQVNTNQGIDSANNSPSTTTTKATTTTKSTTITKSTTTKTTKTTSKSTKTTSKSTKTTTTKSTKTTSSKRRTTRSKSSRTSRPWWIPSRNAARTTTKDVQRRSSTYSRRVRGDRKRRQQ
ncbi:MAG: hypothetical protein EXX96DRAFT_651948 [Benjaminiella poitrasii]|nr:MAG: hypothetical protein EXX96DRAFT_651948 [Benjaminiella poitrasii]